MEIKRTANAGVSLKLDGVSILLDGVCEELPPYLATPDEIRKELTQCFPDVVAFTHMHKDHYDESYAKEYKLKTLRPVYGSECSTQKIFGNVTLKSICSRHIGRADVPHTSYVIEGSKCVWFMGDASPLMWKNAGNLPKPDVVIVPYAYAITPSAWQITKNLGAKDIVLLHLPRRECDEHKLWDAVEQTVQKDSSLHIPQIGQTLVF